MKEIRWAILGCGKIARKFASDLQYVKNSKLIAVGARDQATAEKFAKEFLQFAWTPLILINWQHHFTLVGIFYYLKKRFFLY